MVKLYLILLSEGLISPFALIHPSVNRMIVLKYNLITLLSYVKPSVVPY